MIIWRLFLGLFLVYPVGILACSCNWEAGSVTLSRTSGNNVNFSNIVFQQTYATPPVVIVYATSQGGDPSHVKIGSVTTSNARVAQVEFLGNDGRHVAMSNVHYIAMEPGTCVLPDGTHLEAGHVTVSQYQNKFDVAGSGWDSLNFAHTYAAAPIVLHQLQSLNNEQNLTIIPGPYSPFLRSEPGLTEAITSISGSGANVALELSEMNQAPATSEQLGYIAIVPVTASPFADLGSNAITFDAFSSGSVIDGWDQGCDWVNFPTINSNQRIALWSKRDRLDDNGGWPRRCGLQNTRIQLTMDEDRASDNERGSHAAEPVSVVVFNRSFVDQDCDVDLEVEKTASQPLASEGGSYQYVITIDNNSADGASGVNVQDVLPPGVTCSNISASTGTNVTVFPPTAGCP